MFLKSQNSLTVTKMSWHWQWWAVTAVCTSNVRT